MECILLARHHSVPVHFEVSSFPCGIHCQQWKSYWKVEEPPEARWKSRMYEQKRTQMWTSKHRVWTSSEHWCSILRCASWYSTVFGKTRCFNFDKRFLHIWVASLPAHKSHTMQKYHPCTKSICVGIGSHHVNKFAFVTSSLKYWLTPSRHHLKIRIAYSEN